MWRGCGVAARHGCAASQSGMRGSSVAIYLGQGAVEGKGHDQSLCKQTVDKASTGTIVFDCLLADI